MLWYEQGFNVQHKWMVQPSFSLDLKKNCLNRIMHFLLLLESGTEITEPKEISKRVVAFYSELYRR